MPLFLYVADLCILNWCCVAMFEYFIPSIVFLLVVQIFDVGEMNVIHTTL